MDKNDICLNCESQSMGEIADYVSNPLWNNLCDFVEETFSVLPQIEYSKCSMKPGWNVKYKKSSRAICTLYPDKGDFTCLLVIGSKEAMETELKLASCNPYINEIYKQAKPFNGGRWLMIDVKTPEILNDVKELICIRTKPIGFKRY